MATETGTIDLNSANGGASQANFSSNSSFASRSTTRSRFKYRGKMSAVKAMNKLPPVDENDESSSDGRFRALNNNKRAVYYCIAIVLLYIFIGTLTYSLWIPEWNAVDAMYFSVATFTTIGYGDIVPMTSGQQAFTIFFILLGGATISFIGFAFLFDHLYNSFEEILKESKALTSEYFLERLDQGGLEEMRMIVEEESSFWSDLFRTVGQVTPMTFALIVPPLIMGYYEDWTVLSSFYFTVVSASTIGYGDITPKNTWMRLITVFYMPLCIGVMAKALSELAAVYIRHKAKAGEQEYFNRKLSENDFALMEVDGEGNVGYDEFLVFMLVAMGKVSPEDIQKMEELYQRLDADNDGVLKIEDLFTMAYGEVKEEV